MKTKGKRNGKVKRGKGQLQIISGNRTQKGK